MEQQRVFPSEKEILEASSFTCEGSMLLDIEGHIKIVV
jgi:hypothetical protein